MKRVKLLTLIVILFALGCTDKEERDEQIFELAKEKMNTSIEQLDLRKEYLSMLNANVDVLNMVIATIENNNDRITMVSDTLLLLMKQNGIVIRSMTEDDFNTSIDMIAELVIQKIAAQSTVCSDIVEPIDYNAFTDYGGEFFYGETKWNE